MDARFAAAIDAAAAGAPMSNGEVAAVEGRLLLADGDGLCYYCAGNEKTSPGEARKRLLEKLQSARRASGASRVKIVTTASGSHKGHRYAVARVKDYQGHRQNHRPKNWQALREYLELSDLPEGIEVEFTDIAEADDLFARYALNHPDCVIYTQDKDMRMIPGWHLDWVSHIMFKLDNSFRVVHNDKVWGRAWFWSQMLHGDTADNIPGLPFYINEKGGQTRVGEKAAVVLKDLALCQSDMGGLLLCQKLYRSCYEDRWLVEMLEQGILLWMRNDATSSALNVAAKGNPLHALTTHELWPTARAEILQRIAEAMVHEEAEDSGDSSGEAATVAEEQHAVRALFPSVQGDGCSAGPLPLLRAGTRHPAPDLQCVAGEGGERVDQVRREEPVGIPAWVRQLLAAPRDAAV